jgi:hypothetical protein
MSNNQEHDTVSTFGSYEVGHGKPPKHSQYQKGKSGNPKGRPKGSKNPMTIVKEVFDQIVPVFVNGKPKKLPAIAALAVKLLAAAMSSGDPKAIKLAFDMYAKCVDVAEPSTIVKLMAGQTSFELTPEEYEIITKLKLSDGAD